MTEPLSASGEKHFPDLDAFIEHAYAQRSVIPKDDLILQICTGKSVLDLGCIDHSIQTALDLKEKWLHSRLYSVAREVTGLDILAKDVQELNQRGYRIIVGDAESFSLHRSFDVIVAGDLIEHVSNIGLFLEAASRHMENHSRMVVTTPNPFNVEQFFNAFFRNYIYANPQHTVWIDPKVMFQLISRSPLEIVNFQWVDTRFKFRLKRRRLWPRIINPLSEGIMKRKPILRRDYAVLLKLRDKTRG